jgi:hypothetical protein
MWGGSSTLAWMPTYVYILRIPQMILVWISTAEWYWQGKTEELGEKTCPSATLSTTNPTWIDPGANPGLRGERPATARPIQFEINWMIVCFRFVDKTFVWSTGLSHEKAGGTSDVWIIEIPIGSVEAVLCHLSRWECYLKRPESGGKERKPYLERAVLCDGRLLFHT